MGWDAQGNLARRSLTIEEHRGSYLDPMYYLSERGQDIYDRMMYYVDRSESEKVSGTVSRSGDIVTFEVRQESSMTRWQFDASQGCNLVTRLAAGPSVTENWTREYEKIAGAFVPKLVVEGYTAKGGDEFERSIQREITFTNQAVNEPVNPSEFELAALGVQPGDWVRDNRTNTGCAYGIEGSAELAGVVVDLDGAPVGECQVLVDRADDHLQLRETVCGSDGAFHFAGLPEGSLTLQASIRPTEPGVVTNIARRSVRAGSKDVRLVLPMQQKVNTVKPVAVGEQAPELVLEGSPGGPAFSLATVKGKPVVVAIVSMYSRPCVKVLDDLKTLQEKKGADKLAVIAVHDRTATPEEIEQFRKDHSIPFPIVRVSDAPRDHRDSGTFRTYGATGVPWLCLLSPSGTVLGAGLSMEEVKAKIEKPE
jgi:peroxiredoxin